jgi:cysteine desulfurase/selenocysteine lyase
MTSGVGAPIGRSRLDVERVREDFPILRQEVHGKPLVYLDNAATSQKPRVVIEAIRRYYERDNANIHRGLHALSERATAAYEDTRAKVRRFLGAREDREIVFTRGTTESINLVAATYGRQVLRPGDEVVLSTLEHHSNIVPWQLVCEATGARLRVIPITDAGELELEEYERLLGPRTKIVAIGHVSNALGTINPVKRIVEAAHSVGARVLVDGAQAAPHLPIDVVDLGCDFYAFSGHKVFGPTGAGVLWGRAELLEEMPPYQGGGEMIRSVSFEGSTWNRIPHKFEAGTPSIADVIGLGAAIDYVTSIGFQAIGEHEHDLLEYATARLRAIPKVRIVGTAREKASVISFVVDDIHPHDIGTVLDREGVAIRAGHHCAQPLMRRLGLAATARASFALYNTRAEVDALVAGIERAIEVFS